MTSAADAAEVARANFGLGSSEPVPDLVRLIERVADVPVISIPLGDDQSIDGLYVAPAGAPVIVINSSVHHVRRRFTLAHEYGHHVLKHGEQLDIEISQNDVRSVETGANEFAGLLLLPDAAIGSWQPPDGLAPNALSVPWHLENVARLACDYGVSAATALVRLKNSGAVVDQAIIRILERQIRANAHRAVIRRLDLDQFDDTITRTTAEVRLPEETQRTAERMVESGLLSLEALETWLLPPEGEDHLTGRG